MRDLKNSAASAKQRLLTRAQATGEDYQRLLVRYAAEGFLLRLSGSPFHDRFVLKGAMLFAMWGLAHRHTRDLDFAALGLPLDSLAESLNAVCTSQNVADGLVFDEDTFVVEPIRIGERYEGVRIKITAFLERTRVRLQVDSVPGDAIHPPPVEGEFKTLLGDATPVVRAYPVEAALAEKLHAMVLHGESNSRLKDFFDVQSIAGRFTLSGTDLSIAVQSTFARRSTPIEDDPLALCAPFYLDRPRQARWHGFLDANALEEANRDFVEVGLAIQAFLLPPWQALAAGRPFDHNWEPGGPWRAAERSMWS